MQRVTVVGVGALGSHLVQFLRNEPAALKIIDCDRVEQRNLASQFHGRPHLGKLKAESLKQTVQFLYGRPIEAVPHRLAASNVEVLLGGSDLIVDCLDNAETRQLVQRHVREHTLPCVHGALAADGAFGRVVWDEAFVIDEEANQGAATCTGGEFLPFIALTAAYLARAVQEFLASGTRRGYSISTVGTMPI